MKTRNWDREDLIERVGRPLANHLMSKVYFVRCGDYVKIGQTANIASRMEKMRCLNPYPIEVLREVNGGKDVEFKFHARFKHLRHYREWFRYEAELREFLETADG